MAVHNEIHSAIAANEACRQCGVEKKMLKGWEVGEKIIAREYVASAIFGTRQHVPPARMYDKPNKLNES